MEEEVVNIVIDYGNMIARVERKEVLEEM